MKSAVFRSIGLLLCIIVCLVGFPTSSMAMISVTDPVEGVTAGGALPQESEIETESDPEISPGDVETDETIASPGTNDTIEPEAEPVGEIETEPASPEEAVPATPTSAEDAVEAWLRSLYVTEYHPGGISLFAAVGDRGAVETSRITVNSYKLTVAGKECWGSVMYKMAINGETAFCLQLWKTVGSGEYVASNTYDDLTQAQQTAIAKHLANYAASAKGDAYYAAAQVLVWESAYGLPTGGSSSLYARMISGTAADTYHDENDMPVHLSSNIPDTAARIAAYNDLLSGTATGKGLLFWADGFGGQHTVTEAEEGGPVIPPDEPEEPETPEKGERFGYLQLKKYNHENLPLGGSLFKIESDAGFVNDSFAVPYGGETIAIPIPEGQESVEVTVTEIQAPTGYVLDSGSQKVTVYPGDTGTVATLSFINHPLECSLLIFKYDADNPSKGLPGGHFRISYVDPNVCAEVWFLTTSSAGIIELGLPAAGAILVEELEAPSGYVIEGQSTYTITVAKGENKRQDIPNRKKPVLGWRKECSVTGQVMPGVLYDLYLTGGQYIGEFETGPDGTVNVDLEPGTYRLVEKRTLDGYILDTEEKVIEVEPGKEYFFVYKNVPQNPIIIKKSDYFDGNPIPDTWFLITKVNGEFVAEGKTGPGGYLTIAGIEPGFYLVRETQANPSYISDGEVRLVELKAGAPAVVEFRNKPRTGGKIQKLDAITSLGIEGVPFVVRELSGALIGRYYTDKQGIINIPAEHEEKWVTITEESAAPGYKPDPVPRTVFLESGKLHIEIFKNYPYPHLLIEKTTPEKKPMSGVKFRFSDSAGREIGIFTTTELGQIHLTGMDAGVYYVQEVETWPNYQLDEQIYEVVLEWGKTTPLRLVNKPLASLRLIKRSSEDHSPVPNTEFLIMDMGDNILLRGLTDDKGILELPATFSQSRVKIREISAAPGFALDEQVRTVYLTPGQTTEVFWDNEPVRGQIQIIKTAGEYNDITKTKKDAPLADAVYEIFRAADNAVVDRITTDSRGIATTKLLPLGVYGIREIAGPRHFILDDQVVYAEIKVHGDLVKFEMKNLPEEIGTDVQKYSNYEVLAGDTLRYDFKNIRNTSTVELEEFYFHDLLPTDALRLASISTGTWSERLTYRVLYKTNLQNYRVLADNLSSLAIHELDCRRDALKLKNGEYITDIKFDFGMVQAGFHEETQPWFLCTVNGDLPNEYRIVNRCDVGGRRDEEWSIAKDSWVTLVYSGPRGKLPKTGL